MANNIKSQLNLPGTTKAYVNFFTIVLKDYVRKRDVMSYLQGEENVNIQAFSEFIKSLFNNQNYSIRSFIHGSVNKVESISIVNDLRNILSNQNKDKYNDNNNIYKYKNNHVDLNGYNIYREILTNEYNVNHAVLNFYQIGQENIENIVKANMVKKLCGYIYFTQLRINEQLGYTAKAKVFSESSIIYYLIFVQGSAKTPDYMDIRIENVVELMKERIASTTEDKFSQALKAVVKQLGKKDKDLKARSLR